MLNTAQLFLPRSNDKGLDPFSTIVWRLGVELYRWHGNEMA